MALKEETYIKRVQEDPLRLEKISRANQTVKIVDTAVRLNTNALRYCDESNLPLNQSPLQTQDLIDFVLEKLFPHGGNYSYAFNFINPRFYTKKNISRIFDCKTCGHWLISVAKRDINGIVDEEIVLKSLDGDGSSIRGLVDSKEPKIKALLTPKVLLKMISKFPDIFEKWQKGLDFYLTKEGKDFLKAIGGGNISIGNVPQKAIMSILNTDNFEKKLKALIKIYND